MKKFSFVIILFISIFYTSFAFSKEKLVEHNPCEPKKEIECMIKVLKKDLKSSKSELNESQLGGVYSRLAVGYAKLKNYKKSEYYRNKSIEVASGKHFSHNGSSDILTQYMVDKKYDLVETIISESNLSRYDCNALTQRYLYERNFSGFKKVLEKSNCSIDYISSLCEIIPDAELPEFLRNVRLSLPNTEENKELYDSELSNCLIIYTRKQYHKNTPITYDEILERFGVSFSNKKNADSLKAVILRELIKSDNLEETIKAIDNLELKENKLKQYEKLVQRYAYKNDLRAIELNKDLQKLYRETKNQITPSEHPRDYQKSYQNNEFTDVGAVMLYDIKDLKFKLLKMTRLLDYVVTNNLNHQDFPELRKICKEDNIPNCIFDDIKEIYNIFQKEQKVDKSRGSVFGLFAKANALIGNYEYEGLKYDTKNYYTNMISKKRRDCEVYMQKEIDEVKEKINAGIDFQQYYSTMVYVAHCLYTNGEYLDYLYEADGNFNKLHEQILLLIPSRLIINYENIIDDIELVKLNISFKHKKRILSYAIRRIHRDDISLETKNELLEKISQLRKEDSQFSKEFKKLEEQKNKKNESHMITVRNRTTSMSHYIVNVVRDSRDFNVKYRQIINAHPMAVQ